MGALSSRMGFRFYRRIQLFPGITFNVGKRGVSTSIGERGAHITIGHGKVRETVGLPGTGLSYTHVEATHKPVVPLDAAPGAKPSPTRGLGWLLALLALVALLAAVLWQSLTK
jgi:hypothetical protein